VPCSPGDLSTATRNDAVILLAEAAEALTGNTPITITLALVALTAFGAYIDERRTTRHRQDAQDKAMEAKMKADEALAKRVKTNEDDILMIKMIVNPPSPPRSGSWPTVPMQVNDR
jgi:hypothetical protein